MKKVGIVLLAAGNSRRYHGIKLLDYIQGKKMYMHILENAATIHSNVKIMVTQYEEIKENALEHGYEVVMNNEPELGISHSIHLGLEKALEIEPDLDAVLFSVCDQPYLTLGTIRHLLNLYEHSDKSLASVSYEGVLGNPCIIGKKYFKELFELEGDVGGKKIIMKHLEDLLSIPIEDEKELIDIDVRDDTGLIDIDVRED